MARRRLQLHEALYLGLGLFALVASLFNPSPSVGWPTGFVLICLLLIASLQPSQALHLLAFYLLTWFLYQGISQLVHQLEWPRYHELLMNLDCLFRLPPAQRTPLPLWIQEILCAGYLTYLPYLHWVLVDSLWRHENWRSKLSNRVFTAFALGFVGYLAMPAAPPLTAFPALFSPTFDSGLINHFNTQLNVRFAAQYDAFPSLHVLITLTLLGWDWHWFRRRFWVMLGPAVLMTAGTILLNLHYVADVIVSFILFALIHVIFKRQIS